MAVFKSFEEAKEKTIELLKEWGDNEGGGYFSPDEKDQMDENTHFGMDLGMDSLDEIHFLMLVEKELNISIPDNEAEKLRTVKDYANYLTSN